MMQYAHQTLMTLFKGPDARPNDSIQVPKASSTHALMDGCLTLAEVSLRAWRSDKNPGDRRICRAVRMTASFLIPAVFLNPQVQASTPGFTSI